MLIEIVDGLWVDPEDVKVIKAVDDGQCAFWVTGQSAMDGFVIPYPAEELVEAIHDAIYGDEEDDSEEENG